MHRSLCIAAIAGCCAGGFHPAWGQTEPADLAALHAGLRAATDEATRLAVHETLLTRWAELLASGAGFSDELAAIPGIGVVDAGEGKERLRVIGWNAERDDRTHAYGCFVVTASDQVPAGYRWEQRQVGRRPVRWDANTRYRDGDWPGALYYAAIPMRDGRKPVYLLLGWDGADGTLNRKVAETWELERDGVKFGTSRLEVNGLRVRRLVLSYREDVSAMLRWEPHNARVVMDHLANPPGTDSPLLAGPDMTYDALVWRKGRWVLEEQIEAVDPDLQGPWNDPKPRRMRRR